jgi:excisionase family DNA binding protein
MTAEPDEGLLTLAQAAARLGCSPRTVRRYVAAGVLRGYRVGPRMLRVTAGDVDSLGRPLPTMGSVQ